MKTENLSFNEQCWQMLRHIPEGKVTTYRELARALNTRAWRAVGTAMAKNTRLIEVPCHRVVRSNGEIGEYALGRQRKAEILQAEGIAVENGRIRNLEACMYRFDSAPRDEAI